jgi:primary-amine oxidase
VYWTEHKDCEQLALRNPSTSATGCATQLSTFANGETVTNGVVWVAVSWHHVPRDEDEPTLQTHWQNLLLAPRDFLNTSPVP